MSPVSPIGFQFFGTAGSTAGVDLTFVGAPGCRAYQSADLGAFVFPVTAGAGDYVVALPASPSLAGASLFTQSVALTLDNALNLATSNGLWGRIGF